jgi:dTDP-4-dehydrorhamnose reductase
MNKSPEKKRLLLTGASGFLGWNIGRQTPPEWEIFGVVFSHPISWPGHKFQQEVI